MKDARRQDERLSERPSPPHRLPLGPVPLHLRFRFTVPAGGDGVKSDVEGTADLTTFSHIISPAFPVLCYHLLTAGYLRSLLSVLGSALSTFTPLHRTERRERREGDMVRWDTTSQG